VVTTPRLSRDFFARDTVVVARETLGKQLVHIYEGKRISGIIIETEAYRGEGDLACHARTGRTPRIAVMYGQAGHAYVYFNYGIHWLLNFVTEHEGFPGAVLIRGVYPIDGLAIIARRRRGQPRSEWVNGPAKLCQAFCLDKRFNGVDICSKETVLFVEDALPVPDSAVTIGPRVGLTNVQEPWKSIPWRFYYDIN
jgi:DNA-3-methyladenine glycosylase